MKDYPRVVWMDSSVRFTNTGDLRHIKGQMLRTGGVLGMLSVWHSIYSATHPQLYDYFPTVMKKVKEKGENITAYSVVQLYIPSLLAFKVE